MDFKKKDIKLLKDAVDEKYGRPVKTTGECNLLAQEITASVAGERISQKTVQRLFQQNMTNFSQGILNVLANTSVTMIIMLQSTI